MPFSSKAQEIHDHIVSTGKADYWMGVAKLPADRRGGIDRGSLTAAAFMLLDTSSKPSSRTR